MLLGARVCVGVCVPVVQGAERGDVGCVAGVSLEVEKPPAV